jgi:ankyrin repeat protein
MLKSTNSIAIFVLASLLPSLGGATANGARSARDMSDRFVRLPSDVESVIIDLAAAGDWLCCKGEIAGKQAGWFVIDTGSTSSFIDSTLADSLNLHGIWRSTGEGAGSVEFAEVDQLKVGPVTLRSCVTGITDFNAVNSLAGFKIAGLIGDDVLREYPFSLDFRKDTLILYSDKGFTPPRGVIPERLMFRSYHRPCVAGRIEGFAGWFMIDTGDIGDITLSSTFVAQHWGNLRGRHATVAQSLGLGGISSETAAMFGPAELLGRTVPRLRISSQAMPSGDIAGRVGVGLLADLRITFDFRSEQVWVERYPPETVSEFLKRFPREKTDDLTGATSLMRAVAYGRPDIVTALLQRGDSANMRDHRGESAIFYARGIAKPAIVSALLHAGADANLASEGFDHTALQVAAGLGELSVVKILINAGAKVDHQDARGRTALSEAAMAGHLDVADILLTSGANPKLETVDGNTALSYAAAEAPAELIRLLIRHGAPVNGSKMPPILVASANGNLDAIRALIDARADVDAFDPRGRTALMWAAIRSYEEIVKTLLAAGADPEARSVEGKKASEYATDPYCYRHLRLAMQSDGRERAH